MTLKICLKLLQKKVYFLAFGHRKTDDRITLNQYKYVTVHDMELRIEPAVVKRVGLSEYVFYYVSNVFRHGTGVKMNGSYLQ